MQIIYVLIILSLVVAAGFLAVLFWAIRTGQFDDLHTPSIRMLFDDNAKKDNISSEKKINKTLDQ